MAMVMVDGHPVVFEPPHVAAHPVQAAAPELHAVSSVHTDLQPVLAHAAEDLMPSVGVVEPVVVARLELPLPPPPPLLEALVPAAMLATQTEVPPPPPLPEALASAARETFSFGRLPSIADDALDPAETTRFAERRGRQTPRRVHAGVVNADGPNEPMEVDIRRRRPVDVSGGGRFRSPMGRSQSTSLFARDPDPEESDRLDVLDLVSGPVAPDGVEVER